MKKRQNGVMLTVERREGRYTTGQPLTLACDEGDRSTREKQRFPILIILLQGGVSMLLG